MYQLGPIFVRLEHISMVGSVEPVAGRHNVTGFQIRMVSDHLHTSMYGTPAEASAAHAALLQALSLAGN